MAYYLSHIQTTSAIKKLQSLKKVDVSLFTISAPGSMVEISDILKLYGVCVIDNFIDRERAVEAGDEVETLFDSEFAKNAAFLNQNGYQLGETVWQVDEAWTNDYLKMASNAQPVVNIRSKKTGVDDSGMVDIFGVNKLTKIMDLPKISQIMNEIKQSNVKKAISSVSGYGQRQSNIYINRGVTQTRGPHIDNNDSPYKLFVYLSDVENESIGPYCYLPGSHKRRHWMSYERLKNAVYGLPSTEVSSIERTALTQLKGRAGTAIISCQSGIHSGWPQSESSRRLVLVSNFY